MADRTISFDLLAVDKASRALEGVGREVTDLARKIDGAGGDIRVDADTSRAREKLAQVDSQLARLNAKSFKVDADTAQAQRDLAVLEAELKRTTNEDRQMKLNLDITTVQAKLRALAAEKVAVDVDTAGAEAKVRALESQLRRVDGQDARVEVNADVDGAVAGLARVIAMAAAIPTAITVAVGAVGFLAGAGAALGVGMGAGIAGTTGLGDAVKALGEKSTAAGGAAKVSASAIRSANQAVVDARRDLVRANEDVQVAEQGVQRAQEDAQRAQEALADARRSAARELEDYQLRAAGMALSEESAALSVAEAQDRLRKVNQDAKSTSLERARAELTVREAIQRQNELSVESKRLTEDKTAAEAKGVEGSAQVVSAQDKIRDANQRVADAQRNLARANENVTRATERVAEAITRLHEAAEPKGGGGGGGVDKLAKAMGELGPNAQSFARYLRGLLDGPLKDLRQAGQEQFLPGVRSGLEFMETKLPGITPGWVSFSREIGVATGEAIKLGSQLGGPLLQFATESLHGLEPLGHAVQDLGADLGVTFTRLSESGTAEQAMRALSDVVGALLPALPPLIEAGAQVAVALGPGLAAVVRELAQSLTDAEPGIIAMAGGVSGLLSAVAPVSPELLSVVAAVLTFKRVAGEVAPAIDLARGAMALFRQASADIPGTLDRAAGKVQGFTSFLGGPWGLGLAAGTALLGMWAQKHIEAAQRVNELTTAIEMDSGVLGRNSREKVVNALESDGALKAAQALGISLKDLTDAALGNSDAQARVNARLEYARDRGVWDSDDIAGYAANLKIVQDALGGESDAVRGALEETKRKAEADGQASAASGQHAAALGVQSGAADGAAAALGRLTEAGRQNAAQFLSSEQSSLRYEEALARLQTSIDQNGNTINIHTEKGRANREALLSLVQAANDHIAAMQRSGAPISQVTATHDSQRAKLVEVASQLGMTRTQAQSYINKILETPQARKTTFTADTSQAMSAVNGLISRIAYVGGQLQSIQVQANAANVRESRSVSRSSGGWVPGRPSAVDSVRAFLAPGEFVVRSSAAAEWGPLLERINRGEAPPPAGGTSVLLPAQRGPGAGGGSSPVVNQHYVTVQVHGAVLGTSHEVAALVGTALQEGVRSGALPPTLFSTTP